MIHQFEIFWDYLFWDDNTGQRKLPKAPDGPHMPSNVRGPTASGELFTDRYCSILVFYFKDDAKGIPKNAIHFQFFKKEYGHKKMSKLNSLERVVYKKHLGQ